jgi:hypothetical protein
MSCREALSIVNGLEGVYGGRITFVHANIHDAKNLPLMKQYAFSATPEFYLVNAQGRVIGFWNEAPDPDELRRAFDAALTLKGAQ